MSNRDCTWVAIALSVFTGVYCLSTSPVLAAINFVVAFWNLNRILRERGTN